MFGPADLDPVFPRPRDTHEKSSDFTVEPRASAKLASEATRRNLNANLD